MPFEITFYKIMNKLLITVTLLCTTISFGQGELLEFKETTQEGSIAMMYI